jgi:cellulose synthase (UDP-forming)
MGVLVIFAHRRRTAVITVDHRDVPAEGGEPMGPQRREVVAILVGANVLLAVWYFSWLLSPTHIGTPWLYGLLVAAEMFNLVQAAGFWWTVRAERPIPLAPRWVGDLAHVDVLIPTYNEPLDVVEPTVLAATRLEGARVTVYLLDDGGRPEMARMAKRLGVHYLAREDHRGAKAGNINHALARTTAPFVAVFDCDHVPAANFLVETIGHLADESVAFVQTPQYYANRDAGPIAAAAAAQQDLFFGVIARGKQAKGAMFCCGTNFVFRRRALDDVGGFPVNSLTEDFELSMRLHGVGWRSVYVPIVLAHGIGPEDMVSYVSQQARWAQGCLSALPGVLRCRLPLRIKVQYLLASSYFLSGWTVMIYMSLPVLRIFGGVQPLHQGSADQFLTHFVPYFACCVLTVAVASEGRYSFSAYSLAAANFGVHVRAAVRVVFRRRGKFVVTPKHGVDGRQLRPILPTLVAVGILLSAIVYALATSHAPSSLTNVAFASIHIGILLCGSWSALVRRRQPEAEVLDLREATDRTAAVDLVTGEEAPAAGILVSGARRVVAGADGMATQGAP